MYGQIGHQHSGIQHNTENEWRFAPPLDGQQGYISPAVMSGKLERTADGFHGIQNTGAKGLSFFFLFKKKV